jgi:putative tryptophan/tyrosine transport system substrate-binding protein
MRRRDFLNAIAGSAAAWPLTVRAQQGDRKRRLGIILGGAAEESETKARITVFLQELRHLGWDEGRNIQIEMRASAGNAGATRKYAAELVTFAPDVILALGGSTVAPLLEATHTVPIVFTITSDPVGNGFVDSLARPGGNVTGFMTFDYGLSGKGPRRKLHSAGPRRAWPRNCKPFCQPAPLGRAGGLRKSRARNLRARP